MIKEKAKAIASEIWAAKDHAFAPDRHMSREQQFFKFLETLQFVGVRNLEDLEAQDVEVLERLLELFKKFD